MSTPESERQWTDTRGGKMELTPMLVLDRNEEKYVPFQKQFLGDKTFFEENIIARKNYVINIKPTWGTSAFRDELTPVNGSGIQEISGELRLQTAQETGSYRKVSTVKRGQYIAGAIGEAGIGVRIPADPTGSQFANWGYFDDNNGFGWGVNQSGSFIFTRFNGTDERVFQNDWNIDPLNESGSHNIDFTWAAGHVSHIRFSWYGYGGIEYKTFPNVGGTRSRQGYSVHTSAITGRVSVIDPNQPLSIEVGNGADSNDNFAIYVGGRQFSIIGGDVEQNERAITEEIKDYELPTQNLWVPLIAVRKKRNFGPSNRTNSLNAELLNFQSFATNDADFMVTYNAVAQGQEYKDHDFWPSGEMPLEFMVQTGLMTVPQTGYPVMEGTVRGTKNNFARALAEQEVVTLNSGACVLWGKKVTTNTPEVTASIKCRVPW